MHSHYSFYIYCARWRFFFLFPFHSLSSVQFGSVSVWSIWISSNFAPCFSLFVYISVSVARLPQSFGFSFVRWLCRSGPDSIKHRSNINTTDMCRFVYITHFTMCFSLLLLSSIWFLPSHSIFHPFRRVLTLFICLHFSTHFFVSCCCFWLPLILYSTSQFG